MSNLVQFEHDIQVTLPVIQFPEYERLLSEAQVVAQEIDRMSVTEDNLKVVKKTLANVNKAVKRLNDERIKVKNAILGPYSDFEKQIKEIEAIVKTADEHVRQQVRDMEEAEREEKRKELEDIFTKRIQHYDFAKVMCFEDWIEPQHLNKTTKIQKAEADMTAWLEKVERDVEMLSGMDRAEDLIREYKSTRDIAMATMVVENETRAAEHQRKVIQEATGKEEYHFKVYSKKDMKFVEMLLNENKIEFTAI